MNHTPQPWTTGPRYGPLMTEVLSSDGTKVIAVVFTHRHVSWSGDGRSQVEQLVEGQANLALIQTAPKLLEALQSLLFIANSHNLDRPTRQACTCHAMKEGHTCPFCKARTAIEEAQS